MEMNCFTCKYGGEEIEDCFTLVGNCTEDFNKWQPKEKMAEIKRRSEEGRLAYLEGYHAGMLRGLKEVGDTIHRLIRKAIGELKQK